MIKRLYVYNDEDVFAEGAAIEMGEDVNYFDWYYTTARGICHCIKNYGK